MMLVDAPAGGDDWLDRIRREIQAGGKVLSAAECAMLLIPPLWAGKRMTWLRLTTIYVNLKRASK